jgi:hypothetical protein
MSSSRTAHILHIKTNMNNYSSTQELLCFETSMGHLMIHCKSIMTHRQCNHHITQLTTSTISNYTFYIILDSTHCSSHQSSYCTNNCQNTTARNTQFPKRICTSNLKNTSSYQCSRMNLCRYRSRTLYSVCKPNMLSYLCTFTQRTSSKKKTKHIRVLSRCSLCCNQSSICRTQIPPAKKQSYKLNSITNTVNQHCFLCCFSSALTMKPETNQLVATNTNHFPTNQKCYLIICSNLQQHRTCKKTQITKETRQMWISLHISHAIDMNTKANCGDCNHHRCSLSIKRLKPIYAHCMCTKPVGLRNNNRRAKN